MTTGEYFELRCTDCETLFDHANAGAAAYECSRCGTAFTRDDSADGDSSRCPSCNIFSAKISDLSCPECGCVELDEGRFEPPPPPTAEELARDAESQARSEAHLADRMAAARAATAAQHERWTTLAPLFAEIPTDSGRDLGTVLLSVLGDGSLSAELRITDAQALACLILDRDPAPAAAPDPAASVRDAHSAMRAAQRAQWTGPDSLARAFDGILVGDRGSRGHTGFSDLGQLLEDTFGGEFGAVGTSLTAATWEGIAQRLAEDGER
ncbi:MAG: hypothetical protein LC798_11995 [Chloroflexi bacterium]|nr:hypothetical protein [Chloroflexota bacterium]